MKPTNFNEEDSLKLINEMISQAKSNLQIGAADAMIRSAYSAITIAILNIILLYTLTNRFMSFWVWTLMIPVSIVGSFLDKKKDRSAIVKTHIDKIIASTWRAFGYCICIFLFAVFAMGAVLQIWYLTILIMPVILVLTGFAEFITGITSKYKPFVQGAYIFWAGSITCVLLLFVEPKYYGAGQFIILIICMVCGFCIPGHILNKKAKEQQHV